MTLNALLPASDTMVSLCDTVPWRLEVISTDLGFLRDIIVEALVPAGMDIVAGSFEFANPSSTLVGLLSVFLMACLLLLVSFMISHN